MAWTRPRTWVAGEIVTASIMNGHVRDNLAWVVRPLVIASTEIDVVNTAVETALLSVTVTGGSMGVHGALRVVLTGDYLNNTGTARQLSMAIKLGATTIWSDASTAVPSTGSRH